MVVTRQGQFEEHNIYVDARGLDVTRDTLQCELRQQGSLFVPVTNLRATDADRDGPQAAGGCCMFCNCSQPESCVRAGTC